MLSVSIDASGSCFTGVERTDKPTMRRYGMNSVDVGKACLIARLFLCKPATWVMYWSVGLSWPLESFAIRLASVVR